MRQHDRVILTALVLGTTLAVTIGSAQTDAPKAGKPTLDCAKRTPRCLELFELEVQHAKRAQLRAAILNAKGVPQASKNPHIDVYDVSAIELPAVKQLDVLFEGDNLVFATYHADDTRTDTAADEKLRKMLVTKYGAPRHLPETGDVDMSKSREVREDTFTHPYGGSGRYVWTFAGGMQLIYKKSFFGRLDLSYVDSTRLKAIHAAAEQQDQADTRAQAADKGNAF